MTGDSPAARFADLPKHERDAILASLSPSDREALLYDWPFWARPEQMYPDGDWTVWLLMGGRGAGKTRVGAEAVRAWAKHHGRIALVAETKADGRDVLVEGESGILSCSPRDERPLWEPSKRRLTWPNGALATLYAGDEPDQLRGPQHEVAWLDELAKYRYPQEAWDNLMLGLRLGPRPRACVTTTPRPIPIVKYLVKDSHTWVSKESTYANLDNLAPTFRDTILTRYEGTTLGRQELHAELLEDVEGAHWTRALIEEGRVTEHPALERIVVGVDPSGSELTECGIVVAGIDRTPNPPHFYVVDDRSLAASADARTKQAVAAYNQHSADRVVGEPNYGGDMVEALLRTVDPSIPYKPVHSSRGKLLRAEPVAALSEQGRLHLVGSFPLMEDEMCSYDGSGPSPNRLDAMVFAVTELMSGAGGPATFRAPKESTPRMPGPVQVQRRGPARVR